MGLPLAPGLSNPAKVSRRKRPFAFSGPWQTTQRRCSSGATSAVKVTPAAALNGAAGSVAGRDFSEAPRQTSSRNLKGNGTPLQEHGRSTLPTAHWIEFGEEEQSKFRVNFMLASLLP